MRHPLSAIRNPIVYEGIEAAVFDLVQQVPPEKRHTLGRAFQERVGAGRSIRLDDDSRLYRSEPGPCRNCLGSCGVSVLRLRGEGERKSVNPLPSTFELEVMLLVYV